MTSRFVHSYLRIWGLAVRVPGYTAKENGFDSLRYHIFGSGTGSTQPREDNLRTYLKDEVAAPVYKTEINGRTKSLC
jgi:hypothetical protein